MIFWGLNALSFIMMTPGASSLALTNIIRCSVGTKICVDIKSARSVKFRINSHADALPGVRVVGDYCPANYTTIYHAMKLLRMLFLWKYGQVNMVLAILFGPRRNLYLQRAILAQLILTAYVAVCRAEQLSISFYWK